ncbi:MAG: NMD3-related protein [Candidatus Verstraetearchaeota archaeon]|nr:NMD3-related protein [Candidatus Verstraetearchaeota archaeon]
MGRFCAKCGCEADEYIHSLCSRCYWKEIEIKLPQDLTVTMCPECRSYLQGKMWVRQHDAGDEDWKAIVATESELERQTRLPEQVIIDRISGEVIDRNDRGHPKTVLLQVNLKEKEKSSRYKTSLLAFVEYTNCSVCMKYERGEHEAVVQVRASDRAFDHRDQQSLKEAVSSFSRRVSNQQRDVIVEIKEKEGGYDIKFSSLTSARIFAKKLHEDFGASIQESPKLVGVDRRTGGRLYKNTISVKIPKYRTGELVTLRGNIYRIIGFDRGRTVVEDFVGRHKTIGPSDSDELMVLGEEQIRMVRLDGRAGSHADLFDLKEMRFIEVPSELVPSEMKLGEEGILVKVYGKEKLIRLRPDELPKYSSLKQQ